MPERFGNGTAAATAGVFQKSRQHRHTHQNPYQPVFELFPYELEPRWWREFFDLVLAVNFQEAGRLLGSEAVCLDQRGVSKNRLAIAILASLSFGFLNHFQPFHQDFVNAFATGILHHAIRIDSCTATATASGDGFGQLAPSCHWTADESCSEGFLGSLQPSVHRSESFSCGTLKIGHGTVLRGGFYEKHRSAPIPVSVSVSVHR
mmetsp:Transcript_9845/g.29265  ORF Transcript_9845/g.29265 Transcript_9845/m.29265 type:complete len:205 (-) Transcript_9845:373-987(-)